MSRPRAFLASAGLVLALPGCGGSQPSMPPAVPRPTTSAPAQPQTGAAVVPQPGVPEPARVSYSSKGRRDPFEHLEARQGAQGLTVASTRLTGILRGSQTPLALVETSDGLGYILRPGDTLGDGRVLEISHDAVVFGVAPKAGEAANRVVLRLATN